MSQQGAALQAYNSELVKCIEDLCTKRDELRRQIAVEEEEKRKLQNDIRVLTERLGKVNESLSRKIVARNEFDRTIAETEAAYMKILESSQLLLNVLKKESHSLGNHVKSEDPTLSLSTPNRGAVPATNHLHSSPPSTGPAK